MWKWPLNLVTKCNVNDCNDDQKNKVNAQIGHKNRFYYMLF